MIWKRERWAEKKNVSWNITEKLLMKEI